MKISKFNSHGLKYCIMIQYYDIYNFSNWLELESRVPGTFVTAPNTPLFYNTGTVTAVRSYLHIKVQWSLHCRWVTFQQECSWFQESIVWAWQDFDKFNHSSLESRGWSTCNGQRCVQYCTGTENDDVCLACCCCTLKLVRLKRGVLELLYRKCSWNMGFESK